MPSPNPLPQAREGAFAPPPPALAGGGREGGAARTALLIIAAATAVRIAFGATLGLGVDETYMVAAGRTLRLGYFDHPPAAWWMAWLGAQLFGTATPLGPRLPFIALFAGTSWLMFLLTRRLFSARAGMFAVVALNCAPVLGVTTGSWILPDGPLVFFLLAAALLLSRALDDPARARTWIGAGLCAGLALFSKYTAVLTLGGFGLWFLATAEGRRALARPGPWLAVLCAAAVFAPVVAWNATHGWASFAFQGGRAGAANLNPLAPLGVFAGEFLFLLPWIGVPHALLLIQGFRRRSDRSRLILCCAALPAVAAFPLIALWSSHRILFHWGTPGWLMLFPVLGEAIARRFPCPNPLPEREGAFTASSPPPIWGEGRGEGSRRAVGRIVIGTAALVATTVLLIGINFRLDFAAPAIAALHLRADPYAEAMPWTDLRTELDRRGLLAPGTIVAAANWHDAGKIDAALGGAATVVCLDPDARQYGTDAPLAAYAGRPVLVVLRQGASAPAGSVSDATRIGSVAITHAGRPVIALTIDRATIAPREGRRP